MNYQKTDMHEINKYLAMWAKCLLQVIDDAWLSSNTKDKKQNAENAFLRDKARNFVNYRNPDPKGFDWICDIFDLDPARTAQKILYDRSTAADLRKRVESQNRKRRAYIVEQ